MLFILGVLSLLQITTLPGMIILKVLNLRGSLIQRLLFTFALSLIFSYCLAFILAAISLYNRWSLYLIFIIEIAAILRLCWDDIKKPIAISLQQANDSFINALHSIFPRTTTQASHQGMFQLFDNLLVLIAFGFAADSIRWIFNIFIRNLGTVFGAWDTVLSWNRWAVTWASGSIPTDSHFYPQLIPANWSITYLFMGGTTIQFFAKGIMPLFALFILLAMLDLGLGKNALGFFAAVTITRFLIKKFLEPQITNGYVDLAVAFFAFLPFYTLLKAREVKDNAEQLPKYLMLGAVFAAGAGVAKQAGMYMLLLFPILAYVGILYPAVKRLDLQTRKKYLLFYGLACLIPVAWYALKSILFFQGIDAPEIGELVAASSATHDDAGLIPQIIASFRQLDVYLLFFIVILAGFFLLDPLYRSIILLLVIPYPFLWAWLAGYDTRNLSIFMPLFGLTSGAALQEVYAALTRWVKRGALVNMKTYVWLLLLILLLATGGYLFPAEKLINKQVELQKQVFSPSKNQQVYDLIAQEGNDTKILTNYPVDYLPGLEKNQTYFTFQDYSKFLSLMADAEVEFMFMSNNINPEIKEYIDREIEQGNYILLFVDKEWITYRMIQIIKR